MQTSSTRVRSILGTSVNSEVSYSFCSRRNLTQDVTFTSTVKCKETYREKYEKAVILPAVQRLKSPWSQKPKAAPGRQQKDRTSADRTFRKFCIFEKNEPVYVGINAAESFKEIDKPSQKPRIKKRYLYRALKNRSITSSVDEDNINIDDRH